MTGLAARLYWNCEHSSRSRAEAWREPENSEGRCGVANDRRVILALGALTCWLALASSAAAQSMLGGVVRYPTGQVAAYVTVVAEKEDTGETWDTRSSSLGLYAFYRLPNGTYTIRVSLSQLSFLAAGIEVRPRQKTALDIPLCICRKEVITVHGSSALPRRLSDGSLGAAFSREAIDSMPISNGENLQSILIAIPGITFTESVGTLAQFTALGQRRFSNRLTIDGVSADLAIDVAALGPQSSRKRHSASLRDIWRHTDAYPDERDRGSPDTHDQRLLGTRSFTRRADGHRHTFWHRSIQSLLGTQIRPDSLAAGNWFANAGKRPEARRGYWDSNLSLGGPILPKRLFYFGTWERQQIDRSVFTTVNVPSRSLREAMARRPGGSAIAPLIEAYPLPNGPESPGDSRTDRAIPSHFTLEYLECPTRCDAIERAPPIRQIPQGHFHRRRVGQLACPLLFFHHHRVDGDRDDYRWTLFRLAKCHARHPRERCHSSRLGGCQSGTTLRSRATTAYTTRSAWSSQSDAWISIALLPIDGGVLQSGRRNGELSRTAAARGHRSFLPRSSRMATRPRIPASDGVDRFRAASLYVQIYHDRSVRCRDWHNSSSLQISARPERAVRPGRYLQPTPFGCLLVSP